MRTQSTSLKAMTIRTFLACALLVLPLGPFTWAQAWADEPATSAGTTTATSSELQVSVEWNTRVAMGQTLSTGVTLTLPPAPTPEPTPPTTSDPGTGTGTGTSASTETPATSAPVYTAQFEYNAYSSTSDQYIALGSPVVLSSGVSAVIENKVTAEWAQVGVPYRQKIVVFKTEGSSSTVVYEELNQLNIEPAYQTVSFKLGVAADDPNQPSAQPKDIVCSFGMPYSYNPLAADSTAQSLPAPTRPNYDFAGWYTGYNATTGEYTNKVEDSSLFTGTSSTTLYAKWTGKKYTVRLDGRDCKGEKRGNLNPWSITVTYGETYAALADVTGTGITDDNTELRGFTTSDGVEVKPTDVVDSSLYDWQTGPLTLYPVWGPARESLAGAVVEGLEEAYGYTGSAVVPEVTVKIPESKDAAGAVIPEKVLVKDRDYTVTCTDNVELSTATKQAGMLIEGAGAYKGSISKSFRIVAGEPVLQLEGKDTSPAATEPVVLPFDGSGSSQLSAKLVTDADSGVSYSLAFADPEAAGSLVLDDFASIDTATGVITVKKPVDSLALRVSATAPAGTNYVATPATGVSCLLSVRTTALSECSVSLGATSYTYSGKAKTPSVTVKSPAGTKLVKGTDYTVKYASGRKAVGTYKVTVTGKGGYAGSVSKSFTIVPKACSKVKATRTSSTTKQGGKTYRVYKLTWSKVSGIDGYQVKRTVTKSSTSTFKPSVTSKLFAWQTGKTVKVQVRTYKKVNGKKYYSAWKTISVKAK